MYHHSEGYPNAPQHSSTEGSPAPPHPALASVLPKESLNKLNSWKTLLSSAKQENNLSPHISNRSDLSDCFA